MPAASCAHNSKSLSFSVIKVLLDVTDIPVIYASLCLAYWLRFHSGLFPVLHGVPPFQTYHRSFVAVSLLWFIVFAFSGLYRSRVRFGIEQVFHICRTVLLAAAGVLVGVFFYRNFSYSRLTVVLAVLSTAVMVSIFHLLKRQLLGWLRSRGIGASRVLVAGDGDLGLDCYRRLEREASLLGFELLGLCGPVCPDTGSDDRPVPYLGDFGGLEDVVDRSGVTDVFLALLPSEQKQALRLLRRLEKMDVMVHIVPNVYSIITSSLQVESIAGMPVVNLRPLPIHGWGGVLKSVFDRLVALTGLVLLSPLFLLVAILIKLDSKGPVIYSQERVGLDGKTFTIYKFRSMKVDAEDRTGPVWATRDDPRKTRLGEFLRKYSIDELPQLVNVLKGDMSLVGPRPERPYFVEKFKARVPHYMDRHVVKTGITGWAQVNGLRGQCPIDERTRYDIWYIENWSFWLDILILLRTMHVVLFKPTGF